MGDLIDHALDQLDADGLVAFLQALVRTPSVYLPGVAGANEQAAARLVYDQLLAWGWHPLWDEVAPGRPNVVAELRGSASAPDAERERLLLFEGHTDVVTPGDAAAWSDDPFGGAILGGRLYGRGAADMKGGVAAMLFAARAIQQAGARFAGCIRLLVPVDEEGLMLGIKALVAQGHADRADGAIICEPEGQQVCVTHKGSLRLRLLSYGRIAHGAMPEQGVNALSGMVRLLTQVLQLETQLQAEQGSHPLLGRPYVSPTVARAPVNGEASQINCLPDLCDAFLDIRSLPGMDHAGLIARIGGLMDATSAAYPAHRFALEVVDDRPPTAIPVTHPLVQVVAAAHERVYGVAPVYGGVPGSTDGSILARDRGIPVVVYGPGDKYIPHQPDEYVELNEVVQAARVYIVAALSFLSS